MGKFSDAIGGSNLTDILDPGDIFGAKAREQAGDIQLEASRDVLALQRDIFNRLREGEAPVRAARDEALAILTALDRGEGVLTTDPNLQFQEREQIRNLRAAGAAAGKLNSGQQLIGEQETRAGLASADIQQQLGRILNLSGFTTEGNVSANQLLQSAGENVAQAQIDVGTARAAEQLNRVNTQNRLLNTAVQGAGYFTGAAN